MFVRRDVSDLFRGFNNGTISTLALLKGLVPDQMSEAELSCLKFGCTCGSCLGGFLSPRLRHMLLSTAEQTFDTIYTFGEANGETWFSIYGYLLKYVPEQILQSLVAYKGLRTGFCMLWKYIADCIGENMLPTEDNIVTLIRNSNEWPPHCRNFIQKEDLSHRQSPCYSSIRWNWRNLAIWTMGKPWLQLLYRPAEMIERLALLLGCADMRQSLGYSVSVCKTKNSIHERTHSTLTLLSQSTCVYCLMGICATLTTPVIKVCSSSLFSIALV